MTDKDGSGREEHSFAAAFHACWLAFHQFDLARVKDENAVDWIDAIKRLMDTSGVEDPTTEGIWVHRAPDDLEGTV